MEDYTMKHDSTLVKDLSDDIDTMLVFVSTSKLTSSCFDNKFDDIGWFVLCRCYHPRRGVLPSAATRQHGPSSTTTGPHLHTAREAELHVLIRIPKLDTPSRPPPILIIRTRWFFQMGKRSLVPVPCPQPRCGPVWHPRETVAARVY